MLDHHHPYIMPIQYWVIIITKQSGLKNYCSGEFGENKRPLPPSLELPASLPPSLLLSLPPSLSPSLFRLPLLRLQHCCYNIGNSSLHFYEVRYVIPWHQHHWMTAEDTLFMANNPKHCCNKPSAHAFFKFSNVSAVSWHQYH